MSSITIYKECDVPERTDYEKIDRRRVLPAAESIFDYDTVDHGMTLDDCDDIRARDMEENWFDDDDGED
ncbi:hypothetical protein KIN20_013837 [Parelaphostrongylus tenuis]|uniref:Uncharacterized protein n=1 Tax=Parelaphostrongylus tenuis TaxID=148309 RepID=A0AAD5QRB6_PARTN|nr:hypothetical protein KIN20_013837 [Parelaphostrongylus tenuis]